MLVNDVPLRTPKGHPLQMSSWALANAMADERMAEGVLDLQRPTLYALSATEHDFVADRRDATIAAIYDASLSEWAADPTLPMETGSGGAGR